MKIKNVAVFLLAFTLGPRFLSAQIAGKIFSNPAYHQVDSPLRVQGLSITDDSVARSIKLKNFGDKAISEFKLGYSVIAYDHQSIVASGNIISMEGHPIDQLFDVDIEPGESVALAGVSLLGRKEALQFIKDKSLHYVFFFGVTEIHFSDGTTYFYDLAKFRNFKLDPLGRRPQSPNSNSRWIERFLSVLMPTKLFAQEIECPARCSCMVCDHTKPSSLCASAVDNQLFMEVGLLS